MRDNGPEPIIVQIKESVRKSDSLDADLARLAALQHLSGVHVERRWAGPKYLERVAFPANFTRAQALAVVATLEQLPYVEKVVPASAFNLEFRAGDFARDYSPTGPIPDAARRGLDAHRLTRNPPARTVPDVAAPHRPNRLIVSWKPEHVWRGEQTGFLEQVAEFNVSAGCSVVKEFRWSDTELVQVLDFDLRAGSLPAQLERYLRSDWVEYVQPDYAQSGFAPSPRREPNDPSFQSQRATLDIIRAPEAWFVNTGSQTWTIAVADSTKLGTPTDLSSLWGNYSSASESFYDSYMNPNGSDDSPVSHGTRVASIVGAQGDNATQMAGISWDVKVMHLKVAGRYHFDPGPPEPPIDFYEYSSYAAAAAISYAWNPPNPADRAIAINMSFGDAVPSANYNAVERQALNAARNNGGNIVAICAIGPSSGNGVNLDAGPNTLVSPACIPTDNVIAVGGTNAGDTDRDPLSHFGIYQVDLGAPSVSVLSLAGSVNALSGNSFSAPQVTGAIGLIKNQYPWESYLGLRDRVLMGVDVKTAYANDFRTGGRLNIEKALRPRTVISNLSTRGLVQGGDNVMIGGFIIGGSLPGMGAPDLTVCIRGLGPSMLLGVPVLGNPKITLRQGSTIIDSNDNWGNHPSVGQVVANGLAPSNSFESALIKTLAPGAYTVVLEDAGTAYGVGLFEIYALGTNQQSRLQNVSTRCLVGTGDNRAIAGSIVTNPEFSSSSAPKRRILMLGNGPRLADAGVPGFLPNPYLEVANSGGIFASNDRWEDIDGTSIGLQSELTENGWEIPPLTPKGQPNPNYRPDEAALWPTFSAGESFTAILGPASGTPTGIGLIEFYEY